ncbi:hypothetical protein ACM26V_15555 [Salipaludibacillus sp. HK11]|uniref:hypothetical protein n=1 Tax=Salipaludibacillus sp. HK11 TaxID=3394320 RepID=UPI0039FCF1EC
MKKVIILFLYSILFFPVMAIVQACITERSEETITQTNYEKIGAGVEKLCTDILVRLRRFNDTIDKLS